MSRGARGDLGFVALRPRWRGHAARIGSKRDGEPERVGLADDAAHGEFGIESGEAVAAENGVVVVDEHVPHRDQDRI